MNEEETYKILQSLEFEYWSKCQFAIVRVGKHLSDLLSSTWTRYVDNSEFSLDDFRRFLKCVNGKQRRSGQLNVLCRHTKCHIVSKKMKALLISTDSETRQEVRKSENEGRRFETDLDFRSTENVNSTKVAANNDLGISDNLNVKAEAKLELRTNKNVCTETETAEIRDDYSQDMPVASAKDFVFGSSEEVALNLAILFLDCDLESLNIKGFNNSSYIQKLSMIGNCKLFCDRETRNIFEQVRLIRQNVLFSSTNSVSEKEKKEIFRILREFSEKLKFDVVEMKTELQQLDSICYTGLDKWLFYKSCLTFKLSGMEEDSTEVEQSHEIRAATRLAIQLIESKHLEDDQDETSDLIRKISNLREGSSVLLKHVKDLTKKNASLQEGLHKKEHLNQQLEMQVSRLKEECSMKETNIRNLEKHIEDIRENEQKMKKQLSLMKETFIQTNVHIGKLEEEVRRRKIQTEKINDEKEHLETGVNNLTMMLSLEENKRKETEKALILEKKTVDMYTEKYKKAQQDLEIQESKLKQTEETILDKEKICNNYKTKYKDAKAQINHLISDNKDLRQKEEQLRKENKIWLEICERVQTLNPDADEEKIKQFVSRILSSTAMEDLEAQSIRDVVIGDFKLNVLVEDILKQDVKATVPSYPADFQFVGLHVPPGIRISLVTEAIERQKGDVIVVAAQQVFDISKEASKEVLNACRIHDEGLTSNAKFQPGLVTVIDKPKSFKCDKIILARLPVCNTEKDYKTKMKPIRDILEFAINFASVNGHQSVLLSAMGTRYLNYPKKSVAMEMYESVIGFAAEHPETTLRDIKFVLFPQDPCTEEAFGTEEMFRTKAAMGSGKLKLLYECLFYTTKFQVTQGDILQRSVDAVVCYVDGEFESLGEVGKRFKRRCPAAVKIAKGQWTRSVSDRLVITSNREIPAREVFHAVIPSASDICTSSYTIRVCLDEANRRGYKRISFPLLTKGEGGIPLSGVGAIPEALVLAVYEKSEFYNDKTENNSETMPTCIELVLQETEQEKLTEVLSSLAAMCHKFHVCVHQEKHYI